MNILLVLFCRIPWRPEYPSRASYQAHSTAGFFENLGKTVPNQSSFLFAPLLWTEFVGGNYHSWLGRCPPIHCSRDKPTVMHSLRWKYTTPVVTGEKWTNSSTVTCWRPIMLINTSFFSSLKSNNWAYLGNHSSRDGSIRSHVIGLLCVLQDLNLTIIVWGVVTVLVQEDGHVVDVV